MSMSTHSEMAKKKVHKKEPIKFFNTFISEKSIEPSSSLNIT